jgi:hypothetical protein
MRHRLVLFLAAGARLRVVPARFLTLMMGRALALKLTLMRVTARR